MFASGACNKARMTKTAQMAEKKGQTKVSAKSLKLKESGKATKRKPQITFATAQKKYGLVAGDLQYLGLPASEKPWDRKYESADLKYIAAKKKAFQETCKTEGEAKKAAKEVAKTKEKEKEHQASMNLLKQWQKKSKLTDLKPQSDSKLPVDIWIKILKMMSSDIELNGVRGPSVIARDLSNVSRVNKELYIASLPAFQHLSTLCDPIKTCLGVTSRLYSHHLMGPEADKDEVWNMLISDPASLSSAQLKSMSLAMHLPTAPPKAVLAHKLMQQIGIDGPVRHPARLLLAIRLEKKQTFWHISDLYRKATNSAAIGFAWPLCRAFAFQTRLQCITAGLPTYQILKAEAYARHPPVEDDDMSSEEEPVFDDDEPGFVLDDYDSEY